VVVGSDSCFRRLAGSAGFADVAPVLLACGCDGPWVFMVTAGGQVLCSSSGAPHELPRALPWKVPVNVLAVGTAHAVVIAADGRLFEARGQQPHRWALQPKLPQRRFFLAACGDGHVLAVAYSSPEALGSQLAEGMEGTGEVFSWGTGRAGQLGLGRPVPHVPDPRPVPRLGFTAGPIACGMHHSLVAVQQRTQESVSLMSFGWAEHGRLGEIASSREAGYARSSPLEVALPSEGGGVTLIGAGAQHSVAVLASGEMWSFGSNEFGQLGTTGVSWTRTPVRVELPPQTMGRVARLVCGLTSTVAITFGGEVLCWGSVVVSGDVGRHGLAEDAAFVSGLLVLLVRCSGLSATEARRAAQQRLRQRLQAAEEAELEAQTRRAAAKAAEVAEEVAAAQRAQEEVERRRSQEMAAAALEECRLAEARARAEAEEVAQARAAQARAREARAEAKAAEMQAARAAEERIAEALAAQLRAAELKAAEARAAELLAAEQRQAERQAMEEAAEMEAAKAFAEEVDDGHDLEDVVALLCSEPTGEMQ